MVRPCFGQLCGVRSERRTKGLPEVSLGIARHGLCDTRQEAWVSSWSLRCMRAGSDAQVLRRTSGVSRSGSRKFGETFQTASKDTVAKPKAQSQTEIRIDARAIRRIAELAGRKMCTLQVREHGSRPIRFKVARRPLERRSLSQGQTRSRASLPQVQCSARCLRGSHVGSWGGKCG